jgi:hypothetical protein
VRSRAEVAFVLELVRAGWNVPDRPRDRNPEANHPRLAKRAHARFRPDAKTTLSGRPELCCLRRYPPALPQAAYTYLLGLYLGDGCIASHPRGVFRLRIVCADAYPELIQRYERAMAEVLPNKVTRVRKEGCTEVTAYSKHWPCLLPQHGPGRKHERRIELTPWQQQLVDLDPRPLLRGLLHSDGCRVLNWVNGTAYPRYHFSNVSADIRGIFGRACDQLGIEWRANNRWSLSVARRGSVALLDGFMGPKR